jgi:succinate dehydrogenase/fumarate reductase flavoprotein subunit
MKGDMLMRPEDVSHEILETDVLVIGGGLAGSMAAIKAREAGADVVIFEKAALRRSGNAGKGMDHLPTVVHPQLTTTPNEVADRSLIGVEGLVNPALSHLLAREGYHRILDLQSYGVEIAQKNGTLNFVPGSLELGKKHTEAKWTMIFFRGADLKLKLAREVRRRGITVIERTVGTQLLTDNERVIGATGVNVRDGRFVVCLARSTVLTTGGAHRLYPSAEGGLTNYYCPTNCGDGHAIAYRVGARLTGMEFIQVQTHTVDLPPGPRPHGFFVILVSETGEDLLKKLDMKGNLLRAHARAVRIEEKQGRLAYWNTDQMPEEAIGFWRLGMANENPICLKFLKEEGLDFGRKPRQAKYRVYGLLRSMSGPVVNEECRTSLEGLYASGDLINSSALGGATGAFVTGGQAGKTAGQHALQVKRGRLDEQQIHQEKARIYAPYNREEGLPPLVVEEKVKALLAEYVGIEREEAKLKRAWDLLMEAETELIPRLSAKTPHDLLRAIEIQNIVTVAQMHAQASLARTETRLSPFFYRVDYPERDDVHWQKAVIIQQEDGKMKVFSAVPSNWMEGE